MSNSLQPHGLYSPWDSPGHNTGVGSHSLLQGIFPNQGSNPGLLHCRWILYQLSHFISDKNPTQIGLRLRKNKSLAHTTFKCVRGLRSVNEWGGALLSPPAIFISLSCFLEPGLSVCLSVLRRHSPPEGLYRSSICLQIASPEEFQ